MHHDADLIKHWSIGANSSQNERALPTKMLISHNLEGKHLLPLNQKHKRLAKSSLYLSKHNGVYLSKPLASGLMPQLKLNHEYM